MKIYYCTQFTGIKADSSNLGYIANELHLGKTLVIGNVLPNDSVVTGRLLLSRKAIPTMYAVDECESDIGELMLYKAHVHDIETRLAPYGVIYKDENITIQAKDFSQKMFEVFRYKTGWLLK